MMQESSHEQTEEAEAVDDPTWSSSDVRDKDDKDEEDDDNDDEEDIEPPIKRKRVRNKKTKLAKCPHCFREFTNLKHHINQQHSQVCQINLSCFFCSDRSSTSQFSLHLSSSILVIHGHTLRAWL